MFEPVGADTPARPSAPGRAARAAALACALLVGNGSAAASSLGSAELLDAILDTTLDHDRAVGLHDVVIEIGDAELHVDTGVLVPTHPIDGRRVELVFVGQARFRIGPPDEIEAGQLRLFTGRSHLDAPVEAAVLVLTEPGRVERLLERFPPRELRENLRERAETFYRELLRKSRSGGSGVAAAIYLALIGDDTFRHYFGIACRSYEFGDFVYQLRLQRHIRIQQRKGRWLGVRMEDLGAWDIWLSSRWEPADGDALPGRKGFEARHYELDVTVRRRKMRLLGEARITIEALDDGRRAVPLELFRDLVVERVADEQGRELFFFRSGGEYVVVLPEPSRAGERFRLDVSYGGRVVKWVGPQIFDLEDTDTWYPHCGTVDRATYDVTLRWPGKYEMVASGRLVGAGRNGKLTWERRLLEIPSIAFSFIVGDLYVERLEVGHVELTVGFAKGTPRRMTEDLRKEIIETITDALNYFERSFGPYPLDELSVVSLPRRYSQSYIGFVTLSYSIVRSRSDTSSDWHWVRDTTIAHELAHQWWGNMIGWASYRDQWLSEAMANYSALLFYAETYDRGGEFLAEMSSGWRDSLTRSTVHGIPIESLGPIVLGGRLNSSVASNGYRAIVYRKGAVVLAMLARAIGQDAFVEMLHSLIEVAAHQVVTTEEFLAAIERMSGLDLDGFARQFVYGTGVPDVYYDYRMEPRAGGGWHIRGQTRRLLRPDHRHRIAQSSDGRWDALRLAQPRSGDAAAALMVPYRITVERSEAAEPVRRSNGAVAQQRIDQLFLTGGVDEFAIESDVQPAELSLDPRGEVLARFYSARDHPKLVAIFKAQDLAVQGRLDDAEVAFRRALDAEIGLPVQRPSIPWMRDSAREGQVQDARIRLALARLFIDGDRDVEAAQQLDAAEALLGADSTMMRMERDALRSRLDIRAADYESAFRRLNKTFRLAAPRRALNWDAYGSMLRLSSEREAMTDAFVLHAIAAYEVGNRDERDWALREARDRGAEVSLLEQAIARRERGAVTDRPVRVD